MFKTPKFFQCQLLLISLFCCFSSMSAALDNEISECTQIVNDKERLKCFDSAAAKFAKKFQRGSAATSQKTPEIRDQVKPVIEDIAKKSPAETSNIDKASAEISQKRINEEFGFENIVKNEVETLDKIYVDVTKSKRDPFKKLTLYLANGHVWKQTDSATFRYQEKNGQAYIERGSLGSFFFSQDDVNKRVRVKRIK